MTEVVQLRSASSVKKREQSVIKSQKAALDTAPAPSYTSFEELCRRLKCFHIGDHWVVTVSKFCFSLISLSSILHSKV